MSRSTLEAVVPLSRIVHARHLRIDVVHDAGIADRRVSLVATTEMDDLARYVVADELVLTAGVGLARGSRTAEEYVGDLAAAGVAALGFGIEPVFSEIPGDVVDACRSHGLTLLAIPPGVPFQEIVQVFAHELQLVRTLGLRALASRVRALVSSASRGSLIGLLDTLARDGITWAAVLDEGEIWRSTLADGVPDERLLGIRARLDPARGLAVASDTAEGEHLIALSLVRSDGTFDSDAALVVCTKADERVEQSVLTAAATLAELIRRGSRDDGALAKEAIAALLIRGGFYPPLAGEPSVLSLVDHTAPSGRITVIVARAGDDDPLESDLDWWRTISSSGLVTRRGNHVVALVDAALAPTVEARARRREWAVLTGDRYEIGRLEEALAELPRMTRRLELEAPSTPSSDGTRVSASGALDPDGVATLARRVLQPLEALAPERAREMASVLHEWLAAFGSWEETSRRLGMHRNSVRRIIQAAQFTLALDLDDQDTRTALWIALQWRGATHAS